MPDSDDPIVPGVPVSVETLLLGMRSGRLTYRAAECHLGDNEHPDTAALRLAGFAGARPGDGRVLHSTSWRFAEGRIVLTYAALPDPEPATATLLGPPTTPAGSADPLAPSPPQVDQPEVAAHACRHLAFLRHTDPAVAAAGRLNPRLWALLDAHRPDVAGRLREPRRPAEG